MAKRKKKPKINAALLKDRQVRIGGAASSDNETMAWKFSIMDWDGPWGLDACRKVKLDFRDFIINRLANFESMTWAELYRASGGRKQGNNHHPIKVEQLSKKAVRRLEEIMLDDVDEVVSISLGGRRRLFGIRDRRALKILWFDSSVKAIP